VHRRARSQAAVRLNADLLSTAQGGRAARRSNRRERNKLFTAISQGNFDDIDLYDEAADLDEDLVEAMFAEQEESGFGGRASRSPRSLAPSYTCSRTRADVLLLDVRPQRPRNSASRTRRSTAPSRSSSPPSGTSTGPRRRPRRPSAPPSVLPRARPSSATRTATRRARTRAARPAPSRSRARATTTTTRRRSTRACGTSS